MNIFAGNFISTSYLQGNVGNLFYFTYLNLNPFLAFN
jgi:hypothetical protein